MPKIAKNSQEGIRNSDTLENVDLIKMHKIAKNDQEVAEILIPLKTLI